ncbi:hypothetical protein [Kribbella sp. CA-294648]|uniref:hypothetical protein n=1 Tax=Kribbella sp. CA-294648 TaxID=3239948 RepID=UPI003D929047
MTTQSRALSALNAPGFRLIVGAPRKKTTDFEDHVETVAYIPALRTQRNDRCS